MSQENVEVVRGIFEAFNRRNWAAWESLHHPMVEWTDPPDLPGGGVHRGLEDVRRSLEETLEVGYEWRVVVDGIESVGRGRVLMRGRSVLVGNKSGVPMEDTLFQLFDLEDGRVLRVQTFRSDAEALEAAGLLE